MYKPISLVALPALSLPMQTLQMSPLPLFAAVLPLPGYRKQKAVRAVAPQVARPQAAGQGEFLAMLAHELRNPLEPIRSAAAVLARLNADGPAIGQKAVSVIERQLHHLTRLVDDLLDVSRLNYGKVQLCSEPIRLTDAIDAAIDANRAFADTHRLSFDLELPKIPVWVLGDVVRLTQVFSNLLHNAAKFSVEGGVIGIAIRCADNGRHVTVAVRDDGIGIAAPFIASVFDLFAQGEVSPVRGRGGLGIGLSVVRSLTELHGGKVAVFSAGVSLGSEFVVTLPTVPGPLRLVLVPDADAARAGQQILLVDDNRDAAESMQMLLEMEGHIVHVAFDGRSALEQAALLKPDAVILDIGLPDMSGYEVARRLRADLSFPAPMLIAMTGYGGEQDQLLASEAGFDHHFVKPADHEVLLALLAK